MNLNIFRFKIPKILDSITVTPKAQSSFTIQDSFTEIEVDWLKNALTNSLSKMKQLQLHEMKLETKIIKLERMFNIIKVKQKDMVKECVQIINDLRFKQKIKAINKRYKLDAVHKF
ncbi:Hypothetical_protein [Hexamita inflata]|uniref:Hypothetical_protein n=1 Tax=Hexamita inflata TaxID=28002 RepID=A0AA86PJ46_9EUKA|nr:Hypothetical protein HINF_LOCUS24475 [Hexamita inflata]